MSSSLKQSRNSKTAKGSITLISSEDLKESTELQPRLVSGNVLMFGTIEEHRQGRRLRSQIVPSEQKREARRRLITWISGRGGAVTPSELSRSLRMFKNNTELAEAALNELAAEGVGHWGVYRTSDRGGPPKRLFCIGEDPPSCFEQENLPAHQPMLLKPAEAAKVLSISPRKLWSLTKSGEVPHLRVGRCVRYSPDELRAWITQKTGE
jgi:excisionase family DNA binding protein